MRYTISVILLICGSLQAQFDCESLRNCRQCIRAPSCGWYLQSRPANGSGCFKKDRKTATEGYFHPPEARLYVLKNESGSAISPQEVSLILRANEPFTFPVAFTPARAAQGRRGVELRHQVRSGSVKLAIFSDCSGEMQETTKCNDVEPGSYVEFVIRVQMGCSRRQPEKVKTIEVRAFPGDEVLRMSLYAYCYCPCEMESPEKSPECRGRGRFTCGVCYCDEGYSGTSCEENTANTINVE